MIGHAWANRLQACPVLGGGAWRGQRFLRNRPETRTDGIPDQWWNPVVLVCFVVSSGRSISDDRGTAGRG